MTLFRYAVFLLCISSPLASGSPQQNRGEIDLYSDRAIELLRDAISRETSHGRGLVPKTLTTDNDKAISII